MSATRLVSGPLPSAVLKKGSLPGSSGALGPAEGPAAAGNPPHPHAAPGTAKDSALQKGTRTVLKTYGRARRRFSLEVELRVTSCGEISFYCLEKENKSISPGKEGRVKSCSFYPRCSVGTTASHAPSRASPTPGRRWERLPLHASGTSPLKRHLPQTWGVLKGRVRAVESVSVVVVQEALNVTRPWGAEWGESSQQCGWLGVQAYGRYNNRPMQLFPQGPAPSPPLFAFFFILTLLVRAFLLIKPQSSTSFFRAIWRLVQVFPTRLPPLVPFMLPKLNSPDGLREWEIIANKDSK